jgi:hypothetical protein
MNIALMKSIRIRLDAALLAQLDASEGVRSEGPTGALWAEYLERRQLEAITRQYRTAYSSRAGLDGEFAGWEDQGSRPADEPHGLKGYRTMCSYKARPATGGCGHTAEVAKAATIIDHLGDEVMKVFRV